MNHEQTPAAADTMPATLERRGVGQRGPQKAPTKQIISIRLDADVLEKFRATGPGWQSRINEVLRKYAPRRRAHDLRHAKLTRHK